MKNLYAIYFLQGLIGLASAFFSPASSLGDGVYKDVYQKMEKCVVSTTLNLVHAYRRPAAARYRSLYLSSTRFPMPAFLIGVFIPEPAQAAAEEAAGPGTCYGWPGLRYIISEAHRVLEHPSVNR